MLEQRERMSLAFPPLTWVGDRGDGDLVVGFTCAEACDDVLDPPQLLSHLDFLMLLTETHTHTHTENSKRAAELSCPRLCFLYSSD